MHKKREREWFCCWRRNGIDAKWDQQLKDVWWIQQEIQTFQPYTGLLHDFLHVFPPLSFPFPQIPCMSSSFPFFFFLTYFNTDQYTHFAFLHVFRFQLIICWVFSTVQVVSFEYFIFLYILKFLAFSVYPTGRLV